MQGPKWPFFLRYVSHDTDPWIWGVTRLPRKARDKTRTPHACVLGDCFMCLVCDCVI